MLRVGRYVPDSTRRRALTFLLLLVYHSAHALGKTCAVALLAQVSWIYVVAYTVVDHVFFQLYKLMRGDFIYWAPGAGGPLSLFPRFVVKVVVDFTGASRVLAIGHPTHRGFPFVNVWIEQDWCTFDIRASSGASTTCSTA
jgi:hypothetical protein